MARDLDALVERLPHPAAGRRPVHVRGRRRAGAEGPRGRPGGQRRAVVATGVNADGYREILGVQVSTAEAGAGWLGFFRDLVARGLTGVALVTSDAHRRPGRRHRRDPARRAWQRCRTHYAANLMAACPKSAWPWVKALLHSVFDQPDAAAVHAQFDRILDALTEQAARGRRPPRRRPRRRPGLHRLPQGASGARSGPTTPTSGSTARSAAAPTSSASSPTGTPSSASSAPSSPNNTTNGPKAAATSASTSSPAAGCGRHRHHHQPRGGEHSPALSA